MAETNLTVESVDADNWDGVRAVVGTTGDAAGCWCQWFKVSGSEFRVLSRPELAERLRASVEEGSPGVLARIDGEPVGWSAVEPFSAYPVLGRSPITRRLDGDPADPWAVTCFVVRTEHRQKGVARALLRGAVEHARERGAATIEGYPVDPGVRPSLTNSERYHGTVSLFESAGFALVRRPSATRAIMRLGLTG
jgi:GNAT superfamily N-acetyltransferase